jgi:hypothetical protein
MPLQHQLIVYHTRKMHLMQRLDQISKEILVQHVKIRSTSELSHPLPSPSYTYQQLYQDTCQTLEKDISTEREDLHHWSKGPTQKK